MNRKRKGRAGFVLVFVIVLIGLVGLEMFVLTSGSSTILQQSDRALLEAVEENLVASALAWAKVNIGRGSVSAGQEVSLAVPEAGGREPELKVIVESIGEQTARVRVKTVCGTAKLKLVHSTAYDIKI
jgi:hypothetical protein